MSLFENDFDDDDNDGDLNQSQITIDEGLLPAQQSSYFLGHNEIEQKLLKLWLDGRMPHAIILNGLKGIGKATFAYRLARFILKETSANNAGGLFGDTMTPQSLAVSMDDPVFTKIASGGHPDLLSIGRPFDEKTGQYKNDIPVSHIRKVAPFLRMTSSDGGWRIVIIDDANMMNRNGQNALLKILEEPPKNALLVLVTHGAGGLLPTIRSRCQFVSFNHLEKDDIASLLNKASSSPIMPGDLDLIIEMAQGSAGQAIELLEDGGVEAATILLGALAQIQNMSENQLDSLAVSYGKSGDKKIIEKFTFIISWWFEMLIDMAVNGNYHKICGAIEIEKPPMMDLQKLLRLKEDVDEHIITCHKGNIDKRYMIFKSLRMIQNACR